LWKFFDFFVDFFALLFRKNRRILWSKFRFFMEKIGEFYGAIFAFLRKKKDFFMQKKQQKKG